MINVVYPLKFQMYFKTWSESIVDILKEFNIDSCIKNEINSDDSDIEIIHVPLYYGRFEKKKNKIYIMIQAEQLPNEKFNSDWQQKKLNRISNFIDCYDIVWDTYYEFHKHLYNLSKIKVIKYNLGYHKFFDKNQNLKKENDVSFFGTINDHRMSIFESIKSNSFSLKIYQKVYDNERDLLINKSKINLNLHFLGSPLLETLRVLLYLISNKAFVITEPFIGDRDIKDKEHLVVSSINNMKDTIKYYLKNENERNAIANNGYEYLKNNRTMYNGIKTCLEKSEII